MTDTYSITALAREFDITTRTIRFYEDKNLLQPQRRGTTRIYSKGDRTRLKLVLRGRRLGWPLNEIRDMISMYDHRGGERKQLDAMIQKLQQNRAVLVRQREDIDLSLAELNELEQNCIQQLDDLQNTAASESHTNAASN